VKINHLLKRKRTELNLTMEQLGKIIGVNKAQIYNWENGLRNPKVEYLEKLSTAIGEDYVFLAAQPENAPPLKDGISTVKERYFENTANGTGNNADAKGKGEAIFITHHNVMWVPLVTQYAYAGYLNSYQNHTYMEELEKIPFFTDHLGRGNYLAFEVRGDSMDDGSRESICSGERLLCREVKPDHWRAKLHLNKWTFVIVHKTEGIIIKKITNHDLETGVITIHSLNAEYPDQQIHLDDVKQLFNVIKFDRKL
jgi:DNA-binding XRE family transcriptional regulator